MTAAEIQNQIDAVDVQIDAVGALFLMRLRCRPDTAGTWQNARNRCPDLVARWNALYLQRGNLQVERDRAINREYAAQQRREEAARRKADREAAKRLTRCAACDGTGHQLAA